MSTTANQEKWAVLPLIEVATLQRGYDLPVQDRTEGRHPIFAANGPVGFHGEAKCKAPGVVTGRSGTIGKVHFVSDDYWPLNTSLYVTDFHGNDPRWVYYMLQDFGLERFSQGAGVPTLNRNLVHGELIQVPPLPEQRRIAAILDKADALRTRRRQVLAQLDLLVQSIFVDMFGESPKQSKGWRIEKLPDAADFQEGPGILAKDFRETGVPLIRLAGLGAGEVSLRGCNFVDPDAFAKKWAHFALSEGDILVLTSATFGKPAVVGKMAVGAIFYTGIVRFRPKHGGVNATYLRHFLASPWFLRQASALASGAVIKHFGPTHLKQMSIPVPSLAAQQQFARRAVEVENLRVPVAKAMEESKQLFASLQDRAFQGTL